MANVGKRKYPALIERTSGKWYTGYEHDWNLGETVDKLDTHEIRKLELQYAGYSRGRSAANIMMKDKEGFEYRMSMSGFDLLITLTDAPAEELREHQDYDIERKTSMTGKGVWYCGSFCQTKQGQNYFIEPAEAK